MRAFIALELPEEFITETVALARGLKESLIGRFLSKDSYHLTLAFLGEIDEREIRSAFEVLDIVASQFDSIPLRSEGLGKFGRSHDATFWLGITPVPDLKSLCEQLHNELQKREVPFDDKPFKPHITLVRRARIPKTSLPILVFPRENKASTITLFKSTLTQDGAEYTPLYSVDLRKMTE